MGGVAATGGGMRMIRAATAAARARPATTHGMRARQRGGGGGVGGASRSTSRTAVMPSRMPRSVKLGEDRPSGRALFVGGVRPLGPAAFAPHPLVYRVVRHHISPLTIRRTISRV